MILKNILAGLGISIFFVLGSTCVFLLRGHSLGIALQEGSPDIGLGSLATAILFNSIYGDRKKWPTAPDVSITIFSFCVIWAWQVHKSFDWVSFLFLLLSILGRVAYIRLKPNRI